MCCTKYRNPSQPPGKKIFIKNAVSRDSRPTSPKICRNHEPNKKLPTQKSGEIPTLPSSQKNQSTDLQCKPIGWFPYVTSSYQKIFPNLLSPALWSLNKLFQITQTSTNDKEPILCKTYLIDAIFAKFGWAVFRIPKFNFCFNFVYRTTFFVTFWDAAPNSWCNKKKQFKYHTEQCGHFLT